MYNPIHMSNNFLIRSHRQKEPITAMKMQKMLYFLYRDFLKETDVALFSERFSTWKYGPVLESVYYTYKEFGDKGIKGYGGTPAYSIREEDDPLLKEIISRVWNSSLNLNGIDLSKLTHKPGSAWYNAWINKFPFLQDEDIKKDTVALG